MNPKRRLASAPVGPLVPVAAERKPPGVQTLGPAQYERVRRAILELVRQNRD